MNASEALKKMVLPSHRRPVWRTGIVQIMVGRSCDLVCAHCSQGSDLVGPSTLMTPDEFEQAVLSLQGYSGVYGTFGGNPCLSKYFDDYCRILRKHVPFAQRGLWSNHPRGRGKTCRITYNPAHSNLNTHMVKEAYDEFARDWPESIPYLKGMDRDSIHSSPFVAIKDLIPDEGERWELISNCAINKFWSALIGIVPGKGLRAFLCEVGYTIASLHSGNPDWDGTGEPLQDLGLEVTPGWWRKPMEDFEPQVRTLCHACGISMNRPGVEAINGTHEEFSETHRFIARPKVRDRPMQLVSIGDFEGRSERPSTQYLPNTTPGYKGE